MTTRSYVLFDLGGTLVDLRGIVASTSKQLRAHLGISAPTADNLAREWARRTAQRLPDAQGRKFRLERDLAADALTELLKETVTSFDPRDLVRAAWADFAETCVLHDDASMEWIRSLRSRVTAIGLVTDGDKDGVAPLLDRLDLRALFDAIVLSEDVRAYKPNAKVYRAAMEALHARARETVFVSDSPVDLQGASALGMSTAFIDRGLLYNPDACPPGTVRLSRLPDLNAALDRWTATRGPRRG